MALTQAGAFDGFVDRRKAIYNAGTALLSAPSGKAPLLQPPEEEAPKFPALDRLEWLSWEHQTKGMATSGLHPMDLLRYELRERGRMPLSRVVMLGQPQFIRTAGLIIARQKPPTAKGFAFFVLEDGPSRLQVVISPKVWEQNYETLRDGSALVVEGMYREQTLRVERVSALQMGLRVRGYAYGN